MTNPAYQQYAGEVASKYGIPQNLFFGMIDQESGWNANARSSVGAIGLGQLMPGTAKDLGVNPYDWRQNLDGAGKYLSDQYKRFGRWDLALSAYNSGPGGSEKRGQVEGYKETQNYVASILNKAGMGAGMFLDDFLSPIPGVNVSDMAKAGKGLIDKSAESGSNVMKPIKNILDFFTKDTLIRAVAIVIGLVLLAAAIAVFVSQSKLVREVVTTVAPVGRVAKAAVAAVK